MVARRNKDDAAKSDIVLTCTSVHGNSVFLNERTVEHVNERHPEVLGIPNLLSEIKATIESPRFIAAGRTHELVALKEISGIHKYLAVFYIEGGRVKTIFITSKPDSFRRRGVIWPK